MVLNMEITRPDLSLGILLTIFARTLTSYLTKSVLLVFDCLETPPRVGCPCSNLSKRNFNENGNVTIQYYEAQYKFVTIYERRQWEPTFTAELFLASFVLQVETMMSQLI